MSGDLDPLYVLARKVLLDALEALGEQRRAVILVGAQAVYHHVGEADIAVSPYTEDADLALAPELLLDAPALAEAMRGASFKMEPNKIGIWKNPEDATVDLLVAASVGGPGRRGARLPAPHGKKVARKVRGLEAALVDKEPTVICSFEEQDSREFQIDIACPAALLVAKLIKIAERVEDGVPDRLKDKDALDVFRLLQGTETVPMASTLSGLSQDDIAGVVTRESLDHLLSLFGSEAAEGTQMLLRATAGLVEQANLIVSCTTLVADLLEALSKA